MIVISSSRAPHRLHPTPGDASGVEGAGMPIAVALISPAAQTQDTAFPQSLSASPPPTAPSDPRLSSGVLLREVVPRIPLQSQAGRQQPRPRRGPRGAGGRGGAVQGLLHLLPQQVLPRQNADDLVAGHDEQMAQAHRAEEAIRVGQREALGHRPGRAVHVRGQVDVRLVDPLAEDGHALAPWPDAALVLGLLGGEKGGIVWAGAVLRPGCHLVLSGSWGKGGGCSGGGGGALCFRVPSLCLVTVSLTASARLNGICNR